MHSAGAAPWSPCGACNKHTHGAACTAAAVCATVPCSPNGCNTARTCHPTGAVLMVLPPPPSPICTCARCFLVLPSLSAATSCTRVACPNQAPCALSILQHTEAVRIHPCRRWTKPWVAIATAAGPGSHYYQCCKYHPAPGPRMAHQCIQSCCTQDVGITLRKDRAKPPTACSHTHKERRCWSRATAGHGYCKPTATPHGLLPTTSHPMLLLLPPLLRHWC
jgi:hypothetical protein